MPAPANFAELLVEVLVHDIGLKADEPVPDQRLTEGYNARGHTLDEIETGLREAADREWVRWEEVGGGTFHLTAAGFEAGDA